MTLRGRFAFMTVLASAIALANPAAAAVFGSVVAIGGSASDIALDELRGVLYIANFGASSIQIMSTVDNSVRSSMNVLPFPGAIALSSDSQYLLVAHYCNVTPSVQTSPACSNAITSIRLADGYQQVFSLANPPLGVAFVGSSQALVVTTANILLLSPSTGQTQLVGTIANVAKTLPVPSATFPGQIVEASLTSSADGSTVWGIASAGTSAQLIFQYSGPAATISGVIATTTPALLPRISSASDGTFAMAGYVLVGPGGYVKGRYPAIVSSPNITGSVIDTKNGLIYAQFPDNNQPTGPPTSASSLQPAMLIMDADNLTFRDRINIPEDMTGRAVINSAANTVYAISESGVMVLPVGSLNTYHRIAATTEDILAATNFCNRSALTQSLTITDPGGGKTAFTVSTTQQGVTIVPATGVTPATVQVYIDPTVIPGSGGTAAITLSLSSPSAVNQPKPVRLLVNNPDPSQRGTIIDQPGVLTDILADPVRNRIYALRQDMNQLQVFDAGSLKVIATLRTATSPTMMSMTADQKFLMVGHDDSQLITVYDLTALAPVAPILLPGGHFARSIAVSNQAMFALARNEGAIVPASTNGTAATAPTTTVAGTIDSINFAARTAAALPSLGIAINTVSPSAVLTSAPGGASILMASPDGTVALYTAAANAFVNSRKDLTSLSGAFAASDYNSYVVGNSILDASLVPVGVVNPAPLPTSGFTFIDQGGYMASAASASSSGSLIQVTSLQSGANSPLTTSEAPLLPSSTATAGNGFGLYGSGISSLHPNIFTRTVAPLTNSGNIVVLTTSGLTVLASSYPTTNLPAISAIVSAADGSQPVAPGELVSIYGQNLSATSLSAGSIPLGTALGDACLGANGTPIPLLYVSPNQINAQLPFNLTGNGSLTIHTPSGLSNTFSFSTQPTAPSVFMSGSAGPDTGLALIVRNDNGQLVTPTNPIHPKDSVIIYLTGMGLTTPAIAAGQAAPSSPLANAAAAPIVTLGGAKLTVTYAGLAPGEVGVYQINATVPASVPQGLSIPLVIGQGGPSTTLNLRVVP